MKEYEFYTIGFFRMKVEAETEEEALEKVSNEEIGFDWDGWQEIETVSESEAKLANCSDEHAGERLLACSILKRARV